MVEVKQFEKLDELYAYAAELFKTAANEAVAARGRFMLALSGGGTPKPLYEKLGSPPYNADEVIPWRRTFFFWVDERCVPPTDPESNLYLVAETILRNVPAQRWRVERMRGTIDPAFAARMYSLRLKEHADEGSAWPRFDVAIMGMGSDGHTASLFPGPISETEKTQPVMAVTAEYADRPSTRLTLTPLVLNDARHLIFLVTGAEKAEALAHVINGPQNPEQFPAQRIQPREGKITWLVDQAAASRL